MKSNQNLKIYIFFGIYNLFFIVQYLLITGLLNEQLILWFAKFLKCTKFNFKGCSLFIIKLYSRYSRVYYKEKKRSNLHL